MTFDPTRIADPRYVAENRLPAHSDHRWFRSGEEAQEGTSAYEQCLNGPWKFHYAKNPSATLPGFQDPDFDCSAWDDIAVPAHIQLQGYDRPQYVNVQYPWDGHEQVEPGQVPTRFNPVGSYVRTFRLEHPPAPGERVSVVFNGAESAIAVWLNGTWIGYATDSFTPSEFDLTDALVDGENKLAAQVFKWSSGSWIEDQDFYRFSGLFRDVVLRRRPVAHAEDLRVTTTVSEDLSEARISLRVALVGQGSVSAALVGVGELAATSAPAGEKGSGPTGAPAAGQDIDEGVPSSATAESQGGAPTGVHTLDLTVASPHLWSSEDPHLHELVVEVRDGEGALTEHIPLRVGVRRFGIEDGVLRINGQRIVFKGVNRHEFGLQGRVMTRERTEEDIRLLKAAGLNAVRTSHYPNNSFFYDLCDEYGLYVIDEMNLESHGLWDRIRYLDASVEEAVPGDRPEWLPALMDRAASMFERDKNHPSIVMWSCGNESFGGTDILAVSNWLREVDTRPVHYEGVHWDPRYPATSDVVSQMYTPAAEVESYLREHRDKPFILCEFAHAMGNSFGAVERYLDLANREPLFQGGFIWDFADQAILLRDRHGREYFGYGGDCGEAPHDGDFCGNGIFFADHSPTPRMQEVRHVYRGLCTSVDAGSFTVDNRMLFTASSAYDCVVTLAREGRVLREETVPTDVAPGESDTLALPFRLPAAAGEYAVTVSFQLRRATKWAPAGHEVAWDQGVFTVKGADPGPGGAARPGPVGGTQEPAGAPEVVMGIHNVGVHGEHFSLLFSRLHGGLQSYRYGLTQDGGRELLRAIPRPNFWHAPTANERGWDGPVNDGQWLLASRYSSVRQGGDEPGVEVLEDSVRVTHTYLLPTSPSGECEVAYRVFGSGRVEVTMTARPGEGLPDMPEFGLLLTTGAELSHLRWYGEGPQESYVDRRGGARLGVYEGDVAEQLTPYLRPQEAGNHTGVRWASVTDDRGAGLRLDCEGGMDFSALPWTPFEVENATHRIDLPPIQHTVLRPALMRRGVGGDDSWGAEVHPEYRLPRGEELVFRFGFQGLLG